MISKTNTEVIIENNFISGHNMEDLKMKNNLVIHLILIIPMLCRYAYI